MPYDYLTINEQDLNRGLVSASYFDTKLQSLYEQRILDEQNFFGDNEDDIIELSIYNGNQEPLTFDRIIPKVTYSVIQGNYRDVNNVQRRYDVKNPYTNYAIYKNELLLHTQFDLRIKELTPGSYYALYNPIRNVAGNTNHRLFIKEISPSRTELRLSYAFNTEVNESSAVDAFKITSFANKNFSFLQLIDDIIPIIDSNPIYDSFTKLSTSTNYLKYVQLLGYKTTAQLQSFINDVYVGYSKTINISNSNEHVVSEFINFTGVSQQLKNFVYTYNQTEFQKQDVLDAFKLIVTKVSQDAILQKTTLIDADLQETVNLFVDVIYSSWLSPKIEDLLNIYALKYYGFYKNALNFDNGFLVKILDHTSYINPVDNRVNIQIKLDAALPSEIGIKDTCWISNISISPIYFKINLYSAAVSRKVYLNGVNFNVVVNTVNPVNENYTQYSQNTLFAAEAGLKNKINDLLIDYSDFSNFINFSSAELRTKIAKSKINQYKYLTNTKKSISINAAVANNVSISSSYSVEFNKITEQQISMLNSFDEYESYLFYNTSSIDKKIQNAIVYDSNNYNSLFYQLPEYIKADNSNADYIKFTAMIGHMFDNILVFIKKFPKTTYIDYRDNNSYPKNYIEELLNSFGWDVTNVNFNKSSISQLLFNNTEMTGSLSSSYFDYAKSIFNRLTNNLNRIYKTKGTSTSFDLLRTIFGISPELINVVEYTTPNILSNKDLPYDFDSIIYATKFDSNQFIKCEFTSSEYKLFLTSQWTNNSSSIVGATQITQSCVENFVGVSTIELSFRNNNYERYNFKDKIPMLKKLRNNKIDWQVYLHKTKQKNSAELVFDIHPFESGTTSSIKTIELPYLNGDFYTFMIRRKPTDNIQFDSNPLITQSNALTHSITSSAIDKYIPYEYDVCVNQYYGSQLNFADKKTKRILYSQNQYFSSGSYYIGNYSSSVEFYGNLDKFKMMKYPLSDSDFNEHSYNLNSISIPEKDLVYENLYYLWSFDTPVNLYGGNYSIINNQNYRYNNKFNAYNFNRNTIERGYPYCDVVSDDIFPYQFEKFDIKQAINSNKYGPNYKSNANINKIEQFPGDLVPYEYSSYTEDVLGSDSNLVGYYISPYRYLNEKIEDFVGKEGIIDIIGDPKYITSRNYPELKQLQNSFAKTRIKYIYPQEFYSTYKFYIDFSIFDFIQKLSPARSSLKRGLLVEPSLFERVKFNYKSINVDTVDTQNSSSILQYSVNSRFTSSLINTDNTSNNAAVDITYINNKVDENNTHNFSRFEIRSDVDDRNYIFAKYGKYISVNENGYCIRDTINYPTSDYYLATGNLSGSVVTFTSSYDTVQTIGSGSGDIVTQITGSYYFKNIYSGSMGSGYSQRHLSKFVKIGTRLKRIAISGSRYSIINGVKTNKPGTIKYYTYTKGQNSTLTTVNRKGLPNGSSPIISIPGFLSVDIESDNFPLYGTLTGSIGNPNSIFVRQPLTCSTCTSASINNYIMNL